MSGRIGFGSKDEPQNALAAPHRSLSRSHRIDVLAERIALHIESLVRQGRVRCLDVGCGDMTLAEAVHERTSRTDWSCIDMHGRPTDVREDERWSKYRQFDGRTIPYADGEFDVALLCDVLHHAPEDAAKLLAEAGRVATHVLVKDNFEYGPYSRKMLQLADFVGNCLGEGGSVPERYFTREGFVRLAAQQDLVITALDSELDLYQHLPGVNTLLRRDWQFIAVLRCH
jgi:2-polyprenyl-3-methyl-5-hydroxy-6-metoxy-1,4-benzoquinol methylase